MSIALPAGLPARQLLLAEGVEVLDRDQIRSWGRRPLRLCLVNLMPNKAVTEIQIARLLGGTSIPVELTLCLPDGYRSRSTPADHMAFYQAWSNIRHEPFHALVVTGAPIEALPFEEVTYWPGLCAIFDWARARRIGSLHICWAAQAALYHFHNVPKHRLPRKMSGVFHQCVSSGAFRLLRGFGEVFPVPVSRHTEVCAADLPSEAGLAVLAASAEAGLCLVEDRDNRAVYMFNHLEYDAETLRDEFLRDQRAGTPVSIPHNYFPGDDPQRAPANTWRPYGHLLFSNWLGEIYRTAWPRITDEPVIQWALAGSQVLRAGGQRQFRPSDCRDRQLGYSSLGTSHASGCRHCSARGQGPPPARFGTIDRVSHGTTGAVGDRENCAAAMRLVRGLESRLPYCRRCWRVARRPPWRCRIATGGAKRLEHSVRSRLAAPRVNSPA